MNVLMILADEFNAGWVHALGHPQALTPNLDRLVGSGMAFTNAYCQNPICTPSRVCIASSQYCHNHGYYGLSGNANPGLPNCFRHFRQAGYRTAAYGKLHLPCAPRNWIADDVDVFGDSYETADNQHGSSEFLSGLERDGLLDYEDSWHNDSGVYGPKRVPIDARPSLLPLERTQEVWTAERTMAFIDREPGRPFFVQASMQKPHHPLLPNQRFWELYAEDIELPPTWNLPPDQRPPHFRKTWESWRQYPAEYGTPGEDIEAFFRRCWRGTLACVSQVDYVIGLLLDFLDERGLRQDTVVVFGSDHGAYHSIHGLLEKAPGIPSDEVCRVPMIWSVPGLADSGRCCPALVENVDIGPTLAELCGVPVMGYADGRSLCPLMAGESGGTDRVAVTENAWSKAVRWDKWRLVFYPRSLFGGQEEGELYDLECDPQERRNLYRHPDFLAQVWEGRTRLLEWLVETARVTTPPMLIDTVKKLGVSRVVRLEEDGRASNPFQPRCRDDMLDNYL
ncbi:sulfatase-like hydrolase/transferase [Ruficoccus amylovorans]|uniref:Sulfatase-like hydrolase/transferase n=1 Tax=Ruficoccus amylovorans TaxID=1804625 RepID=A0A842HJT0_9BACT|nr:sulfatase-like hydrolase/transferase [Ruficoccus amylovorans]MBC2595904.1 sulfatase-like hydrolase/transferase [Ruficoccus amylovorans]